MSTKASTIADPPTSPKLLRYWGWQGDQSDTEYWLRANENDSNVMPEEMAALHRKPQPISKRLCVMAALWRPSKTLIAAGFPVILETGHHPDKDWWMGHYVTINAYDDAQSIFFAQDSLIMADFPIPYEEITK